MSRRPAAVHTGRCFVGAVGEGDVRDFTALGDAVNAAARLADQARAGELLVSSVEARAAGLDTSTLESRTLELRGREQMMDAWVVSSLAGRRGSETRTPAPSTPGSS
jgi:adenylate cyclase